MKKYENLFKQALTFVVLCGSAAIAQSTTLSYTPAELTAKAQSWLLAQLEPQQSDTLQIDVSALDERIGDKTCQQELEFSLSQPITQRQNTIKVSCPLTPGWQLYVPVRVDEVITAVVLRQNLVSGSVINDSMLETVSRERRFARGSVVSSSKQVIGAKTRRALSIGQILTLQDVCLVCKGDVVTISVSNNGLNVVASGIAQSDGSLGDNISVLNKQSNRTISADVIAVNQVSIHF
jgi:flagella basal body P-ring formation protein FlgA